MKFIIWCMLMLSVHGRNSRNVEFNELPEEKLLDAVCKSFHKQNGRPPAACDDIGSCEWKRENFEINEFKKMENKSIDLPKLICKDEEMLNFFWESKDDFAYIFQVIDKENVEFFSNVTTCGYYILDNLMDNAEYKIRLWAVSFSIKSIVHSETMVVKTSIQHLIPSPVTNISLQNITWTDDSGIAVIEWNPNDDYSCLYDLVWPNEEIINEDRINVISGSHRAVLKDLRFNMDYSVQIMAIHEDSGYESSKKLFNFTTPTCLEIYHSLDKCHPDPPRNVVITEDVNNSAEGTYNVHLNWHKPDLLPTYYEVFFTNLVNVNRTEKFQNVTGNQTEAVFSNLKLADFYHISLRACSPAGCSHRVIDERHRTNLSSNDVSSHHQWRILVIVLAPLVTVLTGTVIINYYRAKKKRREERDRYFTGLDEEKLPDSVENLEINLIKKNIPDQWELDPNKLYFQSITGEGAFGIVRRACLETNNNTKIQVAVKMLKESPSADDIRQFNQEINIMKSVRQHPYIVSLIGCITEGRVEGPLLVVEYCSRGDLQTYLRNAWVKFCDIQQEILNIDESLNNQKNYFANKAYDLHNIYSGDEFIIQPKHLISIARQVALGMEHLAKTRVVHRDLAARNVLVCENHTVKVSDFGLSRDVYRDNVYCKRTGGKLPIRWMALESLTHQRYTTHSDVWSFGILLWEIVTLGAIPYGSIQSSDLLEFLKNGNRLTCPPNCNPELYSIMHSCWKASPKHRPSFMELCKSLEDLLENISEYLKLEDAEVSPKCDVQKLSQSESLNELYIKPSVHQGFR